MAKRVRVPVVYTMEDEVIVKVKRGNSISEPYRGVFSGGQTFTCSRERAKQLADSVDIIGPVKTVIEQGAKAGIDRMVHASMDREG